MCSYFIRRGQCRAEPSRCIRTVHLLSWEDWPSHKRETKFAPMPFLFTAKHGHYCTTTAHTNKREEGWCCVGTLNLFFNFIFGCFLFLKKNKILGLLLHHQHFACREKHEWLWRERKKIAILETIDKKKKNNAPLSSYAYIGHASSFQFGTQTPSSSLAIGKAKKKKAIFVFISSSLLFSLIWRNKIPNGDDSIPKKERIITHFTRVSRPRQYLPWKMSLFKKKTKQKTIFSLSTWFVQ